MTTTMQIYISGFNRAGGSRLWFVQFPSLNNLRFWFERGIVRGSWAIKVHYGLGAGYTGGLTAYIGAARGVVRGFRLGITRNANKVIILRG